MSKSEGAVVAPEGVASARTDRSCRAHVCSCVASAARVERAVCSTGTAWGLLERAPLWVLALWFLIRHAVYVGVVMTVLIGDLVSDLGDVVLFLSIFAVHLYKLARFSQSVDEKTPPRPKTVGDQPSEARRTPPVEQTCEA